MVCTVCSDTCAHRRNWPHPLLLECVADNDAAFDSPPETASVAYDAEDSARLAGWPLGSYLK